MSDTPTTRIRCTLPNASHLINGVRFGTVTNDAGEAFHVSEPVGGDIAAALLAVPGYQQVTAGDMPDEVIDAAIAKAAAAAEAATPDGAVQGQQQQTIDEMYRANRALSDEITAVRASQGDPAVVAEKDAEITRLGAALATAQARVTELEQANAALAGDGGADKGSGAAAGDGGAGAAGGRRTRG